MDKTDGNSPGGTSSWAEDKSVGALSNAAKQLQTCQCVEEKSTGTDCEFSEECKRNIAVKLSMRLAEATRSDGPYCKPLPSFERCWELLDYNSKTGVSTWKVSRGGQRAGDVAGTTTPSGYKQLFVDGTAYLEHRVIFKMVIGRDPIGIIDHKNGIRSDNRLVKGDPENSNLREVLPWQNSLNRIAPTGSNTGYRGVSWLTGNQRYLASIGIGDRNVKLGLFSCLGCAVNARAYAFNLLVGTPANDNKEEPK